MNYMNYTIKMSDSQNCEMTLAAQEEAVLEKVAGYMDRMLLADGMINIDATDMAELFYGKGTVQADAIKVSEKTEIQNAAAELIGRLQKQAEKELSGVLLIIAGDVSFTDAAEAASLVQEQLPEDAALVFGTFDDSLPEGMAEIIIAAA